MNNKILKDYLSKGSKIVGGAVGRAIGLIRGPAGVLLCGTLEAAFVVGIKNLFIDNCD